MTPILGTDLSVKVFSEEGSLGIGRGLNYITMTEAEWFALLDEVERQAREQHNDRMTGRMAEH